jgi:energy-coupling factor transport system ATP-binding protein
MEDVAKYVDRIVVMNKGNVVFDDIPKNVFAHYKELEEIGLSAPRVTYIMHHLKEEGFPVEVNATTIEDARDEILKKIIKK